MRALLATALLVMVGCQAPQGGVFDFSGVVTGELRAFPANPRFADQDDDPLSVSVAVEPEIVYEWQDGLQRVVATPFVRVDSNDDDRTHADLRELHWLYLGDSFTLLAGVGKVFWGVTESRHLVDVINQTDGVEDIDEEAKLGQPMVNLTLEGEWGALDLFYLPYFRERTFNEERLRGPFPISSNPTYESSADEGHQDWAVRWAHSLGDFDVGLSHFSGTSREPTLVPEVRASGTVLRPHYALMDQTGVDVQWTRDAWLCKLEAISRDDDQRRFFAAVAGFEYTFFQFIDGYGNLGILSELLVDDRSRRSPRTAFDHDVFVGARWSLEDAQDTAILAGAVVDLQSPETLVSIEAERRVGDSWFVELTARLFLNTDSDSVARALSEDDFISLAVSYHF
ncbi:MAG: hypothetical protein AAF581_00125 [Planctomycetota bacterium]